MELHASGVPYWIDAALDRTSTSQTPAQLKAMLQSVLTSDHVLGRAWSSTAGDSFTSTEQAFLKSVMAQFTSAIDVRWSDSVVSNGNQVMLHRNGALPSASGTAADLHKGINNLYVDYSAAAQGTQPYQDSSKLLSELAQLFGLREMGSIGVDGGAMPASETGQALSVLGQGPLPASAASQLRELGTLDIAALQYIYGPNPNARTGNDVYTLSATTSNFIWDGAGSDTISAAGQSTDISLHLTPGYWDYIGKQASTITAAGQFTINFGTQIENAIGGSGNDTLVGNALANRLTGGDGQDRLEGLGGNDTIDGGAGLDTAVYSGARSNYLIERTANGVTLTDRSGYNGIDQLSNVERLVFGDGTRIAFDTSGAAGQAYRLYQAAYGFAPGTVDLGKMISALDQGSSLSALATSMVGSATFKAHFPSLSNPAQFVADVYQNVLHRAPDDAGLAWWTEELVAGRATVADLVLGFSESGENQALIIGAIQNGMAYWLA